MQGRGERGTGQDKGRRISLPAPAWPACGCPCWHSSHRTRALSPQVTFLEDLEPKSKRKKPATEGAAAAAPDVDANAMAAAVAAAVNAAVNALA